MEYYNFSKTIDMNCFIKNNLIILFFLILGGCSNSYDWNSEERKLVVSLESEKKGLKFYLNDSINKLSKIEIGTNDGYLLYEYSFGQKGELISRTFYDTVSNTYLKEEFISFPAANNISSKIDSGHEFEEILNYSSTTKQEVRRSGKLIYTALYEYSQKQINSFNLKVEDFILTNDSVKLVLKNDFPFKGKLEFYYPNTHNKIEFKEIEKDRFELMVKDIDLDYVHIDVSIIPSEMDTVIHSVYTQIISLK